MKKVIVVLIMIVGIFTSCEEPMCEYEITTRYPDGSWTTEYFLDECN